MQIHTTRISKTQVFCIFCVTVLLTACTQVNVSSNSSVLAPITSSQSAPAKTNLTLEVNPYDIEESFSTRELQDEINAIQRQRDADSLSNYLDRIQSIPPARLP